MPQYSPQALLAIFCWIPAVLYIFIRFPPQRAVIVSFVMAWLYLPVVNVPLPGIPDLTKMSATCYGVLLATVIFDAGRFSSFKPSWLDLPMLIWCLCSFASSVTNGLGEYDGFTAALSQTVTWGVPYFLGRLYLADLSGLRQLAIGIFVGGLSYVPLCLIESLLSPQLHRWVYGYHGNPDFTQAYRLGGYRLTVFMQHGLAVCAWMMAATGYRRTFRGDGTLASGHRPTLSAPRTAHVRVVGIQQLPASDGTPLCNESHCDFTLRSWGLETSGLCCD